MSRGGGTIVLMPGALERGARDALRLSDELADATQSLSGISLAGLPPASRGRTAQAIAGARAGVRSASFEARAQGAELRVRAALARAADEGGTTSPLDVAIKLWEGGKWPREALGLSKKYAGVLTKRQERLLNARLDRILGYDVTKELKYLAAGPGSGSPRKVAMDAATRLRLLRNLEKNLERITPWSKKLIDVKKLSPTGPLKGLRGAGSAIPTAGDVITVVVRVKTKKMSTAEALLRGAKDLAITAGAPLAGGALCAGVTLTTGGALAAACVPIMSTAVGIGGKMGSDYLIDKTKDEYAEKKRRERAEQRAAEQRRRHPTGRCAVTDPIGPQARPLR